MRKKWRQPPPASERATDQQIYMYGKKEGAKWNERNGTTDSFGKRIDGMFSIAIYSRQWLCWVSPFLFFFLFCSHPLSCARAEAEQCFTQMHLNLSKGTRFAVMMVLEKSSFDTSIVGEPIEYSSELFNMKRWALSIFRISHFTTLNLWMEDEINLQHFEFLIKLCIWKIVIAAHNILVLINATDNKSAMTNYGKTDFSRFVLFPPGSFVSHRSKFRFGSNAYIYILTTLAMW